MLGFELELEWHNESGWGEYRNAQDRAHYGRGPYPQQSDFWTPEEHAAAAAAEACWASDWTYDCSLEWGLELRSLPYTWAEWQERRHILADWFARHGSTFWAPDTCGLHVHVDRSDFTDAAHLRRLFTLLLSPTEVAAWQQLSGRDYCATSYGRIEVVTDEQLKASVADFVFGVETSAYRYLPGDALRLNARSDYTTLEFRLWAGADTVEGLYARLGGTHALVEYTRDPEAVLTAASWAAWVQARGEYEDVQRWMVGSRFNRVLEASHGVHAGV